MKLIKNEEKYYDFIRTLRTHNDNKSGFLEQVEITPEQQITYMEKYKNNYYICVDENNIPLGWIGEVDNDIRLCTDPVHKGKGIGTFMLNELHKLHPKAHAKVLVDNEPSKKVFIKCGFSFLPAHPCCCPRSPMWSHPRSRSGC